MSSIPRGNPLLVALAGALSVLGGCGGSDQEPPSDAIRQLEIRSLAAYNCMPKDLRRELRVMERRHDARVRQLAREAPPGADVGATAANQQFRQTVESDPQRRRLLRRAQAIYKRFVPGGNDYEPGCYLRERQKAKTRLASLGATGS
jgi:hypothetical protein